VALPLPLVLLEEGQEANSTAARRKMREMTRMGRRMK
jgi:hypothetical protein